MTIADILRGARALVHPSDCSGCRARDEWIQRLEKHNESLSALHRLAPLTEQRSKERP